MNIMSDKLLKMNLLNYLSLIPLYILSLTIKTNIITKIFLVINPIIILVISYFLEYLYYKFIKKEMNSYAILTSPIPYFNLISYYLINPQFNILLFLGLITIIFFVNKKINLNIPSLLKIFATLMLAFIFKDINYPFFINTNDIHLFIAFLASLIIEQFNLYHKKEITFLTLSTYFLASLVLSSLEYISSDKIIELALNSNFIFAAIFVAPISYTSPNNQKERNTYCALIGISSAVLINIKSIFITPYLIIFIVSMIPFVTKILK